jgi:hypothetical protein
MTKKLALLAVALALAVILVLALVGPNVGSGRPVSLAFIGFTNTPERIEALFWFSNRADLNFSWHIQDVSHWSPTGWMSTTSAYTTSRYTPVDRAGLPAPGFADLDLVGIPITTTNDPVRVVLNYFELENVARRRQIWWAEFRANWGTTNKIQYPRRAQHTVTGQTVVAQSPDR